VPNRQTSEVVFARAATHSASIADSREWRDGMPTIRDVEEATNLH
jgi:hypothetical protein